MAIIYFYLKLPAPAAAWVVDCLDVGGGLLWLSAQTITKQTAERTEELK